MDRGKRTKIPLPSPVKKKRNTLSFFSPLPLEDRRRYAADTKAMRRRCVGNGDESKRCSKRLWSGETVDRGEKGRIEGSRHSRESRESHLSVLLIIIINSNLGVSHHRRVRRAGGAGRACP